MQLIFGRKYRSRFGDKGEVDATKRMWAKGFSLSGVTPKAAEYAIAKIITCNLEWPPELPEFLALCEEASAEGLPSPDEAMKQVLDRRGRNRFQEDYRWHHRVVEVVNENIGHYVFKESENSFKTRFNKEYRKVTLQFRTGALPPPHKALPAPALAAASDGVTVDPTCPVQQRIAALRKLSGSKS